jgi:sugar/nucleoside kinase (ribokinase family)
MLKMSTADKNQAPVLTPLIVGAGNPTVDVTAHVTRDELSGLGIHPGGDLSGASQSRKEEVVRAILSGAVGTVVGTSAGGSALNTVRVAAWGQGGRFDSVGTAFVGAVGDDAHARLLEDAMVQCGVISLLKRVDGGACTAVCAALVEPESRDRSLAVVRGAAEHIDVSHLDTPAVAAALARATVIYVTAFMLSTPPRAEMINALARIASTRHPSAAAFALNISSVSLVQKVGSAVLALLSQCCWLFGATEGECGDGLHPEKCLARRCNGMSAHMILVQCRTLCTRTLRRCRRHGWQRHCRTGSVGRRTAPCWRPRRHNSWTQSHHCRGQRRRGSSTCSVSGGPCTSRRNR